jgi:hypothetical protein
VPGTTPNIGLTYPLLSEAADIEAAVKPLALQLDALRVDGHVSVLSAQPVQDVGQVGQLRAGRQLAATDFTNMGLAVPIGLWNLGDLTDASGNGRALVNKGSVPFGVGINGAATTAAVFAGATGQALYIADTGAADPFRIKTGSIGCWLRTPPKGVVQRAMGKMSTAAGQFGWTLAVEATNVTSLGFSTTGTDFPGTSSITVVGDDRWHHVVATFDGHRARLYVDGAYENQTSMATPIFASSGPFNIGGRSADGATATTEPFYGRIDEAFVTADVLSEEQVRALYAARIPHTLAQVPGDVRILVRRRRRGGTLATTDFPTTPVRLHNFTAGSLNDEGSGGVALVAGGAGSFAGVAGADGITNNGFLFPANNAAGLAATDAGLPGALTARSYGCWFKTTITTGQAIMGWGTLGTADVRLLTGITPANAGQLSAASGADAGGTGVQVNDGSWHHAVVVEDNAAGDGMKRKFYVEGRLVAGSTVMNTLTLAGANAFRIGGNPQTGSAPFIGQIDGAFVYNGALTGEQVRALYNKGSQQLAPSPKDATDHIEAVTTADLLAVLDTIEACDGVDLLVAP